MLELNKIYNIDCLEGMKEIDDKSIDLIFTDLGGLNSHNVLSDSFSHFAI